MPDTGIVSENYGPKGSILNLTGITLLQAISYALRDAATATGAAVNSFIGSGRKLANEGRNGQYLATRKIMGDWIGRTYVGNRRSWNFITHIHEELCTRGPSRFFIVSLIYDMMVLSFSRFVVVPKYLTCFGVEPKPSKTPCAVC
jgi:hypothetical protein